MMYSNDKIVAFVKIYMQNFTDIKVSEGHDFHQEFADELGICRQEAKALFHKMNYGLDYRVVRGMMVL